MKKKWQKLFGQAKAKYELAVTAAEGGDLDLHKSLMVEGEALEAQAEALKASSEKAARIGAGSFPGALPTGDDAGSLPDAPGAGDGDDALIKAVNFLRYGPSDDPTSLVMREVYGGDYRQYFHKQEKGFAHYLRTGQQEAGSDRQFWTPEDVKSMLLFGMGVQDIKTTMIEGQDTLGGYAVPAQRAADVITRLPGLTAVRGGGATVVQTASAAIEWLKKTGGGDQYPTGLRGSWGTEVQDPAEKNFTLGMETIPVHTYTYKVAMSQSLVEDAVNIVNILMEEILVTLAIDEDTTFLVGDGAGKPRGFLPSSANADSINAIVTGDADDLTWTGLKNLRRGIASQYRMMNRATWIGNSQSGGEIEAFQNGIGIEYVDALAHGETFPKLRGTWRESEAMADASAGTFPLLFGDLSAYKIIERLGLSIVRFQDSNTGINKVEFHIRRRIGGRLLEIWKVAVQEVSAS